ncbi:MAG: GHKL domain-containing protein [Oscillospiraceae bacterium]|nr:GHKL domain-containing protein [Oscillospiraceae bacterium]
MKFFYYLESIILFHIVAIIYYMSVWSLAKLIVKLTQLLLNDTDPLTKLLKLEDNSVLFVAILIGLIVYIWLYFSFMRKKIFLKMRFTDNLMFLLYYGASFCGAQVVTSASIEFLPSFVRTGGMIICTALIIFMPIMILKIRQSAYYNEMSTRNEQFLEAELIASNAYKQSQEDTRAFRHDMNNNLSLVSAMMKKKQYDEAEEYINGLCGRLSSFSPSVVTGDDMLDSLISSKIPVMREKGIRFAIDGVIDGGLGWKPIDICAVFANLIDNAIEACEKVSSADAYITLLLRKTEHQRVITLKNSTARRVDTAQLSSGSHFTSKADRSRHGFGIKNIQDTAEKNGAMVRFECSDTEFTASVIIMRAGVMK